MDERRRVTRRAQDFDVTCYIDGAKLEAHVLDISRGGVFVRTDTSRPVPVGALAGIVFVPDKVKIATTFMFGRVVRRQDVPVRGFAVRWEKAVSAGKAEELSNFLKTLLEMPDVQVEQEVVGSSNSGGAISRCVYRFPEPAIPGAGAGDEVLPDGSGADDAGADVDAQVPESAPTESAVEPAGNMIDVAVDDGPAAKPDHGQPARHRRRRRDETAEGPAVAPTSDIMSCLNTLDVSDEEVSAVRITTGTSRHKPPRAQEERWTAVEIPEPVSAPAPAPARSRSPFKGLDDMLIPCRMEGSIFVIDSSVPVLVTALGQASAVVRSRFVPVDDSGDITLVLIIGTRRGDVPVRCHGRVTVIERGQDSGFRMTFSGIDEGESPGVLERYLKWLEFNAGSPN